MKGNKLLLRIASSLVLTGCCIWWICKASENLFLIVTLSIGILATLEYGNAVRKRGIPLDLRVLLSLTGIFFFAIWLQRNGWEKWALFGVGSIVFLIAAASIGSRFQTSRLIAWYSFPLFWILCPVGSLNYFRFSAAIPAAPQLLLLLFMIVAFNDIFAYFGGRSFGRHLLAPTISPQKTVEGAAFGVVGGFIGALLSPYLFDALSILFAMDPTNRQIAELVTGWEIVAIVLTVVPASQLGDLAESKFKRYCGIKDSSSFIPGHGGLLDRGDAHLLAIPTYYCILFFVGIPSFL